MDAARRAGQSVVATHPRRQDASSSLRSSRVIPVSSRNDNKNRSGTHEIRSGMKSNRTERSSVDPARRAGQSTSATHVRRQDASSSLRSSRAMPASSSMAEMTRSEVHVMNGVTIPPIASPSSTDRATKVATTSSPATHSSRQANESAYIPSTTSSSISAIVVERNTARAV